MSFSGQSQSREREAWTQKFRRREKQVEQQRRVKRLQRRRRFKHDEPCQNNIIYLLLIDFVTLKKYFKVWYKVSLLAIYFRNETFRLYEHGYNIVNEQEAINYNIYKKITILEFIFNAIINLFKSVDDHLIPLKSKFNYKQKNLFI